jgi:hypothetical protein
MAFHLYQELKTLRLKTLGVSIDLLARKHLYYSGLPADSTTATQWSIHLFAASFLLSRYYIPETIVQYPSLCKKFFAFLPPKFAQFSACTKRPAAFLTA